MQRNCDQICLLTIEQQFVEQLDSSSLDEAGKDMAESTLRSVIKPLILACLDCPANTSQETNEMSQERLLFVDSLLNNPEYTHALYGKFGSKPNFPHEGTYGIRTGGDVQVASHWDPLKVPSKTEKKFGHGQGWRDVLEEKLGSLQSAPKFKAIVLEESYPDTDEKGLSLSVF